MEEQLALEMYQSLGLDISDGVPRLDNHRAKRIKTNDDGFVVELHLEDLKLSVLPLELQKFKHLETLYIGNNKISELPVWFGTSFSKLKWFNATFNSLTCLPEDFGNLSELRYLILTSNKLNNLPESFSNLKNLEVLSLISNSFESVPMPLVDLHNLSSLFLLSNPIKVWQFSNIYSQYKDQTQEWLSKIANYYQHYLSPEKISKISNKEKIRKETATEHRTEKYNTSNIFCYYCKRPTEEIDQICSTCRKEFNKNTKNI